MKQLIVLGNQTVMVEDTVMAHWTHPAVHTVMLAGLVKLVISHVFMDNMM